MNLKNPTYCLKQEDLPCFWILADHVFGGQLSKEDRNQILMSGRRSGLSLLDVESWPEAGLMLSGLESWEDYELDYVEDVPASLPVYPDIGLMNMIIAGLSCLDGESRMRTSETVRDRLVVLEEFGLPPLRVIADRALELRSASMSGRSMISSSIDRVSKDKLLSTKRVLIASSETLRELSRDPITGVERLSPAENEWHVLPCVPDDEEEWLEERTVFDQARRVICPDEMIRLIEGHTPVVWSFEDERNLRRFVGGPASGLPDTQEIICLDEHLRYVIEIPKASIWEACEKMLVTARVPNSKHDLIASWFKFPSEAMADLFMAASLFRRECIRMMTDEDRMALKLLIGPALTDEEIWLMS